MDTLIQQFIKWAGSLSGDSINYIVLGLLGGITANLKSAIEFLQLPTVTWPRGKIPTIIRLWFGILFEIFYRPIVGMVMAYAVDINPVVSFVIGFIAPGILKLLEKDGPKLFKNYWYARLGMSVAKVSEQIEPVRVVSAETLDKRTLKTLEENSKLPEPETKKD